MLYAWGFYMCVLERGLEEKHIVCKLSVCLLQDSACSSLLSSLLVLPLLACDSDALPGAAASADPCRELLLQHHRAPAPTEDHMYPGNSHQHPPTALNQSRSKVGILRLPAPCRLHCTAQGVQTSSLACGYIACACASGLSELLTGAVVYCVLIDDNQH